jgi:bacillithiol system protein YtxJ
MNWITRNVNKDWIQLREVGQLDALVHESETTPVIIYKHSTRCGLSSMAERNLEEDWERLKPVVKLYYLDLIRYREVSDSVAERFNVRHESPQILIIRNGRSIYDASHHSINVDDIMAHI